MGKGLVNELGNIWNDTKTIGKGISTVGEMTGNLFSYGEFATDDSDAMRKARQIEESKKMWASGEMQKEIDIYYSTLVWESGAMDEYLLEKYKDEPEKLWALDDDLARVAMQRKAYEVYFGEKLEYAGYMNDYGQANKNLKDGQKYYDSSVTNDEKHRMDVEADLKKSKVAKLLGIDESDIKTKNLDSSNREPGLLNRIFGAIWGARNESMSEWKNVTVDPSMDAAHGVVPDGTHGIKWNEARDDGRAWYDAAPADNERPWYSRMWDSVKETYIGAKNWVVENIVTPVKTWMQGYNTIDPIVRTNIENMGMALFYNAEEGFKPERLNLNGLNEDEKREQINTYMPNKKREYKLQIDGKF